jgi:hypothetical protein
MLRIFPTQHLSDCMTPGKALPVFGSAKATNHTFIVQYVEHGSISITLDIYSHLFGEGDQHAVRHLDALQDKAEDAGEA